MGNIISNSDLFCHLKCSECFGVLDYSKESEIDYLAYIIGKGKYNKKYYCLNCLTNIINKKTM